MTKKLSLEEIRNFWTDQVRKYGQSPAVSWTDHEAIELEVREISKRLGDGDQVLDIGCASGYSTVQFASQTRINIRGVDFIPQMIEQARIRLNRIADKLLGAVEFAVGDVMALDEVSEVYDKVIVTRTIINLGEWDRQLGALRECARVLKPGGVLLLSEATLQGWKKLNQFRQEWGLPEIPMPSFNSYVDQDKLVEAVTPELKLAEIVNFSSTYYVGTRVLKPLLIRDLGANIDVADPDMEWNRWFAQLPFWGDYGTQKLFVFNKR